MKSNLITVAEACLLLRVSRKTLYRMIAASHLPAPRRMAGFRQCYFDRPSFEAAVKKGLR